MTEGSGIERSLRSVARVFQGDRGRFPVGAPCAAFLVLCALVPSSAFAHGGDVERSLWLEPAGAHLEVVVHLKVSGGDRVRALRLLADRNHDGRVDAEEEQGIASHLATRALDGLRIQIGTATAALQRAESKVKWSPSGPIQLMIHGTAPLPSQGVLVVVFTGQGGDPLALTVLPGTRPAESPSRGARKNGGFSTVLGTNDRVSWRLAERP